MSDHPRKVRQSWEAVWQLFATRAVKQVGKLTATAGVGEEIETAAGVCQIATAAETVPMVEETVGTGEETAAGVCQTATAAETVPMVEETVGKKMIYDDCSDGLDEADCKSFVCADYQSKCTNGVCKIFVNFQSL